MYFPDPRTMCSPGIYGSGSAARIIYGLWIRLVDLGKRRWGILIADFAELHEEIHEFLPCLIGLGIDFLGCDI